MQLIIKKLTVIVGNEIYDTEGELIPDLVSIPCQHKPFECVDHFKNSKRTGGDQSILLPI